MITEAAAQLHDLLPFSASVLLLQKVAIARAEGRKRVISDPLKPRGMPTEDYDRLVSKFCEQYYQVLDRKLTQLNTFTAKSMSHLEGILSQD